MGRRFVKGALAPQINKRYKLPRGLWRHGLGNNPGGNVPVNRESVKLIREFIKKNWVKAKRLNKYHTSTTLAYHISEKIGVEVFGGEVIVAAIFEGYGYEASIRNAFFWADTDLQKPTL